MELVQKGASASLETVKQLMVTMKWTTAVDFDLAVLWKTKDGRKGMVYFGDMGNLNAHPFMKLDKDAGVGDTGGDNQETMKITDLETMAEVHLLCWDYGAVQGGKPARFSDSDLKITVMSESGEKNEVTAQAGDNGNVCVLVKIDNSSPMGATIINESKAGLLKGLTNDEPLWKIADGE